MRGLPKDKDVGLVLKAMPSAASKHRDQRRKDAEAPDTAIAGDDALNARQVIAEWVRRCADGGRWRRVCGRSHVSVRRARGCRPTGRPHFF
jgi:hypothetical protein